jgi:hypothetical protein
LIARKVHANQDCLGHSKDQTLANNAGIDESLLNKFVGKRTRCSKPREKTGVRPSCLGAEGLTPAPRLFFFCVHGCLASEPRLASNGFFQRGRPAWASNLSASGLLDVLFALLEPVLGEFSGFAQFEGLKIDRSDLSTMPGKQKKFRLLPQRSPKTSKIAPFSGRLWISRWISTGWVVGKHEVIQRPSFYTELLLKRYSDYAGFIFELNP